MAPIALVTGASRGTGRAIAIKLAERGYDLVINYNTRKDMARTVVAEIGHLARGAIAVKADLTDRKATTRMFGRIRERYGRLDLLVLNASGGLESDKPPGYAMELNCHAQVRVAGLALRLMSDGGRIVYVTSHWAHFYGEPWVFTEAWYEPVAESKRAGETALLALPELQASGVSVIVVTGDLIGDTATAMLRELGDPGFRARYAEQTGTDLLTVDRFASEIVSAAVNRTLPTGTTIVVGPTH